MNDRELLELAAKASGVHLYWMALSGPVIVESGVNWNPLTDDGDALRLAVRLGIDLVFFPHKVTASCGDIKIDQFYNEHNNDECATTRRAIVCVAAKLAW